MAANSSRRSNVAYENIWILDDDKSHGVELNANNLSSDYVASFPTRSSNATIALLEELNQINVTKIASSGVYTVTLQSWTKRVVIHCQGAGGGGGGDGGAANFDVGAGGGAGAYAQVVLLQSDFVVNSDTGNYQLFCTVGNGGAGGNGTGTRPPTSPSGYGEPGEDSKVQFKISNTPTYSDIVLCEGGNGGQHGNRYSVPALPTNAPTVSIGTAVISKRGAGNIGGVDTSIAYFSTRGADSFLGVGGTSGQNISGGAGPETGEAGGGGGGAAYFGIVSSGAAGGAGMIIIEEYPY